MAITSPLPNGRMSYLDSESPCDGMTMQEVCTEHADARLTPFRAAEFSVAPGRDSAADVHAVREIWFVYSGSGVLTRNGVPVRIGARDVVYFDAYDAHQLHNDGDEPFRAFTVWW